MADLAVSIPVTPADPNKDAAVLEKSTLESLRHVQHKDSNGNVISTSPSLSSRFSTIVADHPPQPSPIFRTLLALAGKDLWIPSDHLKELLMVDISVVP
jgi:hypothetical protein